MASPKLDEHITGMIEAECELAAVVASSNNLELVKSLAKVACLKFYTFGYIDGEKQKRVHKSKENAAKPPKPPKDPREKATAGNE